MNFFRHIELNGPTREIGFTSVPQQGASLRFPPRNRDAHAKYLQTQLEKAWSESESDFIVSHADRHGVYLQFKSSPGFDMKIQSLEDIRSRKIRLCNVRKETKFVTNSDTGVAEEKDVIYATVYVANEKRQFFLKKINQYASEVLESGNPKNGDLVNGIEDVQKAMLQSFWRDDSDLIPGANPEWCEVWLRGDNLDIVSRFALLLDRLGVAYKKELIRFPERTVKLVHVNQHQLETLITHSDDIAEFRRAKDTADFWINQPNRDQAQWVEDFQNRLLVDHESQVAVCILDTGVNRGHPLLSPVLADVDCQTVNPEWRSHDHQGHGTLMAGLSAYGNLQNHFENTETVVLSHVLESVKILPPPPNTNPQELWGDITAQGVNRAEIQAPDRKRVICMAVTSQDTRDRGRPSSWSGAIDQLSSGAQDNTKRIIIVSAGNFNSDIHQIAIYPFSQITDSVHDPAQAWNAITVGAYTQLTNITNPLLNGYRPIAGVNQLSPFSTTSYTWENKWPIKPEIVFEGGNAAIDKSGFVTQCDDLFLVSTYFQPTQRLLDCFGMTSAATAQAAHFAAEIQSHYPNYWPETIRALMIHSAEWPQEMVRQFAADDSKTQLSYVLKSCGYGVPDLHRALYCARNSLTLVSQCEIQPYELRDGRPHTKDMHFYFLPWPTNILRDLGETSVEMRITLSYFIEPGPGEIGWKDRYRYPSHLMRFKLNSPGETQDEFLRRINVEVRDEENSHPGTSSASDHWVIGAQNRDKGSIHSDIWRGTAADLASSNMIAIIPAIGWWRERNYLGMCEKSTRYSLIVSIKTPEQSVDIYTPVVQMVNIPISIGINSH